MSILSLFVRNTRCPEGGKQLLMAAAGSGSFRRDFIGQRPPCGEFVDTVNSGFTDRRNRFLVEKGLMSGDNYGIVPVCKRYRFPLQRHIEIGNPVTGGGIGFVQAIVVVTLGVKYGYVH